MIENSAPMESPGSAETPRRDGRILTIDGARGVAMILVFVAHFSDAYYGLSSPVRHGLLTFVTRVASPAFVWISGIMLGILYHRHREHFERTRNRLIDRGLFLILVGHPLIAGAHFPNGLRIVFITDTIGVAVIVGALLIARAQPRTLAVLGAGMLLHQLDVIGGLGPGPWRLRVAHEGPAYRRLAW